MIPDKSTLRTEYKKGKINRKEEPVRGEEVVMCKDLKIIYKKTEGVVERKIGSAIILVPLRPGDPQNPHIFSLEGIGEDIWQLIDGQRSVGEIFEILSREFAVEKSQLFIDLLEFLEQLVAIGGISE